MPRNNIRSSVAPERDDEFVAWFAPAYHPACGDCEDCVRFREILGLEEGATFNPEEHNLVNLSDVQDRLACGMCSTQNDLRILNGTYVICNTCRSHVLVCTECDKITDNRLPGVWVDPHSSQSGACETCISEELVILNTCTECEEQYINDEDGMSDNLCNLCFEERYEHCDDCDEWILRTNIVFTEYNRICTECRSLYTECTYCRNISRNPEDNCDACPSNYIFNYSFKPPFVPFLADRQTKHARTALLGFELEVSLYERRGNYRITIPEYIRRNIPWLYCKHDSSVGGDGFEIVSHPFTLEFIKTQSDELDTLLTRMRKMGFENDTLVGMHVHITKEAFTRLQLLKFLRMFHMFPLLTETVAQRPDLESMKRNGNIWGRTSKDLIRLAQHSKSDRINGLLNRRNGVNLLPSKTVEVRIFGSVLETPLLYKNLEFVYSLYNFTKNIGLSEAHEVHYLKWLKENNTTYNNLDAFLRKSYGKIYC